MTMEEAIKVRQEADELLDSEDVNSAICHMAVEITERLKDSNPIILCVLNGGLIVTGQLLTRLDFPLQVDYIHATRYGARTTGAVLEWLVKPRLSLAGRTVMLVDDILDEGITLAALAEYCRNEGASEVLMAVLIEKLHQRKIEPGMKADFWGVEVGDRFLFGYGLDYKGYWRNAPGIYAVNGT